VFFYSSKTNSVSANTGICKLLKVTAKEAHALKEKARPVDAGPGANAAEDESLPFDVLDCISFPLKSTYTIKEAQREIATLVRTAETGRLATITRHQKPVAYVISPERLNELLETMEILADSGAMKAIRSAEEGRGKTYDLDELPD
jgi:prevent-host-death family protein